MSVIKPDQKQAGRARRDLRGKQWYAAALLSPQGGTGVAVKNGTVPGMASDFEVDIANSTADYGGMIQEPGRFPGDPTTVCLGGRLKGKARGTGKAGDSLKVSEGGILARSDSGDDSIGRAFEDWQDGQFVSFQEDRHTAGDRAADPRGVTPLTVGTMTAAQTVPAGETRRFSFTSTSPAPYVVNFATTAGGGTAKAVRTSDGVEVGTVNSLGSAIMFNATAGTNYTVTVTAGPDGIAGFRIKADENFS